MKINVTFAPTASPSVPITAAPVLQDASAQPGVSAMPHLWFFLLFPHQWLQYPTYVSQNGGAKASDSDSESDDEHIEISEESRQVRKRQEKALQDLLIKRRAAAALAVPTNDRSIRDRLRRLGEPITLFGEQEMERRARLAQLMARLDIDGQLDKLLRAHEEDAAPRDAEG